MIYLTAQVRRFIISFLFCLALTAYVSYGYAQTKDTINIGIATGLLRDSSRNIVMPNATLSVYRLPGEELVSYQFSNNFGRFQFKQLPVGVPLRIVASNIGYQLTIKDFTISPKAASTDLKTLNMERKSIELKEVSVVAKLPPMQMRGDTLEFNAGAFKLDSNAVVEDMLRKLPGVTVWNDGVITVNGKKIKKLLVEGKEFFGGGNRIALENLAKNAVQKIQVYEDKANSNPTDPQTNMNIVLKKGKKSGYFGKLGAGGGTNKRFDLNGMLSFFNPRIQTSIVGASNNVNKNAGDVNSLVQLNSFKGEGLNNDYYTDFTKQGQNTFKATGFSFLYDFIKNKTVKPQTDALKADYFLRDASNNITQQTQTLVTIDPVRQLRQTASSLNKSSYLLQNSNLSYNKTYDQSSISANLNMQHNKSSSLNEQQNTSDEVPNQVQSRGANTQVYSGNQDAASGSLKYTSHRYKDVGLNRNKSVNMELSYLFDINNTDEMNNRVVDFTSSDTSQNKYFNRRYQTASKNIGHIIVTDFSDVIGLLQQNEPFIRTDIRNTVSVYNYRRNNMVRDLSSGSGQYNQNNNLTNVTDNQVVDERPAVNFSKVFSRVLDNRFSKIWNINLLAQGDAYKLKNTSLKEFQNIERSYFYFIPSASIVYSYFKFGGARQGYSLNYNTSVNYPSVGQLAPLIDDADVYTINYGNINLKPAYRQNLSFHYNYDNGVAKNPLFADFDIAAGQVRSSISDSSYYDALGRNIHFPINVSGNKYASVKVFLKKAYKFNENELQIAGNTNFNYSQNPSSLNAQYLLAKMTNYYISADIVYGYKGIMTANLGQSFFKANTVQDNLNNYIYRNWRTYTNFIVNGPKRFSFGTRVDFNGSKSSSATRNIYYTIWNADLSYRFLKGANGEIKFSALDLLHQNKNVINYVSSNSITSGTVNVLQQYFMISLAYYPRRFGLEGK